MSEHGSKENEYGTEAFAAEKGEGRPRWPWLLLPLLLLLLLALGALFLFRVRTVTVSGNYHNSDAEIRDMVMRGPLAHNSLFLQMANRNKKITEESFIDTIRVEMLNRHAVRISVVEKDLVGYVEHSGRYWYFDRDGIVRISSDKDESAYEHLKNAKEVAEVIPRGVILPGFFSLPVNAAEIAPLETEEKVITAVEIVDAEGVPITPAEHEAGEAQTTPPEQESKDDKQEDAASSPDSEAAEEERKEAEAAGETTAAKARPTEAPEGASGLGLVSSDPAVGGYIPFVEGLSFSDVVVGEVLPVKNPAIFAMLENLKVYINKNTDLIDYPSRVSFDEDWNLILTFFEAKVNLGSGNYLGRRLEQLGGIYGYIAGLPGTLHLENYDGTQERLIFTRERAG